MRISLPFAETSLDGLNIGLLVGLLILVAGNVVGIVVYKYRKQFGCDPSGVGKYSAMMIRSFRND